MKTFKTSGTGSGQSLSEIESERIPVYQTVADAEADLANLEEGQIVMTPDEGAEELLHPVAVVEKDNTHAVQSGAVYSSQQPDWSNAQAISTADLYAGYEIPANGLVVGSFCGNSGSGTLSVNNVVVGNYYKSSSSTNIEVTLSLPVAKGDEIKSTSNGAERNTLSFVPWKN